MHHSKWSFMHLVTWLTLACCLWSTACSDGPSTGRCAEGECALDAAANSAAAPPSTGRTNGDRPATAASKDGGVRFNPLTPDGGSGELEVHLQVNGARPPCGSCAVVLAQAQGGLQPYAYQWSDPSLSGPGPHKVCPDAPTTYTVTVTDSTPNTVGEFSSTAQVVAAMGAVDCVADAGVSGFAGCMSPYMQATSIDGETNAPDSSVTCPDDAGVMFDLTTGAEGTVTVSTENPGGFKAGETYEYSHDRLLPFTVGYGDAITVDVSGGMEECVPQDKFFTIVYDSTTWHQSFCFTPKLPYRYLLVSVHLNGVLFSAELQSSGTICAGCSTQ